MRLPQEPANLKHKTKDQKAGLSFRPFFASLSMSTICSRLKARSESSVSNPMPYLRPQVCLGSPCHHSCRYAVSKRVQPLGSSPIHFSSCGFSLLRFQHSEGCQWLETWLPKLKVVNEKSLRLIPIRALLARSIQNTEGR